MRETKFLEQKQVLIDTSMKKIATVVLKETKFKYENDSGEF